MKAIVDEVDYCVEWSDVDSIVDLVLSKIDIVKNTRTTITIERTDYEDFQIGETVSISFCDAEDDKIFEMKVIEATEDEWTFEYIKSYSFEEYIEAFKKSLPQEFIIEVPEDEEDDIDYCITEEISNQTGWLVYSVSYELEE